MTFVFVPENAIILLETVDKVQHTYFFNIRNHLTVFFFIIFVIIKNIYNVIIFRIYAILLTFKIL